ncbi:hypothetical protein [Fischerella sp.]|nr:hypothetical protein [Fischerella sp.]
MIGEQDTKPISKRSQLQQTNPAYQACNSFYYLKWAVLDSNQ